MFLFKQAARLVFGVLFSAIYINASAQISQQHLPVDTSGGILLQESLVSPGIQMGKITGSGSGIANDIPVLSPIFSIWDQTPWMDSRINFVPSMTPQYAGDLDGDGTSDRFIFANTPDDRSGDLSARTNKTVVYFGGEMLSTEADEVVYEHLFPVGRLFGGNAVMVAYNSGAPTALNYYSFPGGVAQADGFNTPMDPLELFNLLTATGSREVIHSIDLNGDGFDDVASVSEGELRVVFGAQGPENITTTFYAINSWTEAFGAVAGSEVLLDAFEYGENSYLLLGSRDQNLSSATFVHVLRFAPTGADDMEVVQVLTVDNSYFGPWPIVRGIFMSGTDGAPSLLFSSGAQNKSYIFPPSDQSNELFHFEAGPQYLPLVPTYDLIDGTFSAYYRDDENGVIGWASGDPQTNTFNPFPDSEFPISNTTLLFDHSLTQRNSHVYPDLNGDGFTDFMLPLTLDDRFGSIVSEGGLPGVLEQYELTFNRADYSILTRLDVFPLGDVTGNGLDDFGVSVFDNDMVYLEVYEGGNFFVPVAVIPTPFTSISFATAGYFNDFFRRDIAILGRYPGFNPEGPDPNVLISEVHFFEGGTGVGTQPYNIIEDMDVYPLSWLSNVMGTMNNVGDVNNDGFDDLLIGAPTIFMFDTGEPFKSAMYFGGPDMGGAPDAFLGTFSPTSIDGRQAAWFANTIYPLGDMNGDGIDDFAVSATDERLDQDRVSAGHSGAIHIFYGKDGSQGPVAFETSDLVLKTNMDDAFSGIQQGFLGFGQIAVGDFNGDGYPDMAVPTFFHRFQADVATGVPGIHIYNGGPFMSGEPDHMLGMINEIMAINPLPSYYTDVMGHVKMTSLPDITNDGYDELLIVPGRGYHSAVLLEGSESSVMETPIGIFDSPVNSVTMGSWGNFINRHYALAAGDYTGDGAIEFVVAQSFATLSRDTPVFMFSTDEFAVESYTLIVEGFVENEFIAPGQDFDMDIVVGDPDMPVTDLLGVGLQVHFDPQLVDFVNVSWGDFLFTGVTETDMVEFVTIDEENGVLALSLSRQGDFGGVDGSGLLASVTFRAKENVLGETLLAIEDVLAIDSFGDEFPVTTLSPFIVIFDGVFVWPGDTNNDGFVDIADVLPVGAWFGSIGPERPFFDFGWFPQAAFNWDIETLAYVDATGDGTINQNDILPIGLNFGLSVDDFFFKESQETDPVQYLVIPAGFPAGTIQTTIAINGQMAADGIIGAAADFAFDPAYIQSVSGTAGSLLTAERLLSFDHDYEEGSGQYAVAASRLGTNQAVYGEGELLSVTFELLETPESDIMIEVNRLLVTNADRSVKSLHDFAFTSPVVTSIDDVSAVPAEFSLSANFPNPFNPKTTISYSIAEATEVRLDVFDVMGRKVATLVDSAQQPGHYSASFSGTGLASGVYVYRLQAGSFVQTRSMLLVK